MKKMCGINRCKCREFRLAGVIKCKAPVYVYQCSSCMSLHMLDTPEIPETQNPLEKL